MGSMETMQNQLTVNTLASYEIQNKSANKRKLGSKSFQISGGEMQKNKGPNKRKLDSKSSQISGGTYQSTIVFAFVQCELTIFSFK